MSNLNKLTAKIIIVVLAIFALGLIATRKSQDANDNTQDGGSKELSNRDIAIQEALNSPDKLSKRTQIKGETYFLIGYRESYRENKPGWRSGGIIVFRLEEKDPTIFWESKEIINDGRYARFQDVNNDGVDEIVWDSDLGVTGRNNSFYIYRFVADQFNLITPVDTRETQDFTYIRTRLRGDNDLTYLKDIDGDKIYEILVGYRDDNIVHQQTYKFNGEVYELWKEEKISQSANKSILVRSS